MRLIISLALCIIFSESVVSIPKEEEIPTHKPCEEDDLICSFTLVIEYRLTMMDYVDLVVPYKGNLYRWNDTTYATPIYNPLVQADGYYQNPRLVIVANKIMPGPEIIVYENQIVNVKVINMLTSEAITIHFHGVVQKDNNLMDGVSFVTQCPILPGNSFVYEFKVNSPGTDFYHAHSGAQRTQGLFGALITKPRSEKRNSYKYQYEEEEHIMIVNDWNHDYDSNTGHMRMKWGSFDGFTPSINKFEPNKVEEDKSQYSVFRWTSGLINGKGRYHYGRGLGEHNDAPLQVYNVSSGKIYRFRVIAAGTMFPLRITVDKHELNMIATDGYEFQLPEDKPKVESFILSPGERFDFLLDTTNKDIGSYWIRAETLEKIEEGPPHIAEAILQYTDDPAKLIPRENIDYDDPNVVFKYSNKSERCKDSNICYVLNCPFKDFQERSQSCLHLKDLTSNEDKLISSNAEFEKDKFFNFGFPKVDGIDSGSINGRQWIHPPFPPASQRDELEDYLTGQCEECETNGICSCTHTQTLDSEKNYQFVLTNIGSGSGWAHPIHLHGHSFEVVKQGFTDESINCSTELCTSADWMNETWNGGGLPVDNVKPIRKDTVMIPNNGYVVIRFNADNPGCWFMHCHIELHNLDGMAMMFIESLDKQQAVPTHFPVCGNYDPNSLTTSQAAKAAAASEAAEQVKELTEERDVYMYVMIVFVVLFAVILVAGCGFICYGLSRR